MERELGSSEEEPKDWFYWKSKFLDLKNKNEILTEKYKKLENELKIEKQRAKIDAMNIKLLQERVQKLSPSSQNKRKSTIHLTSSSNDSISSLGPSKDNSERTRLFEGFLIASCESNEFSILFSHASSDVLPGLNQEILAYFIAPIFSDTQQNVEINSLSGVLDVLYPKVYRDKNSFVFTLKGNGGIIYIKNFPNQNKEFLYGCCVQVQDIKVSNKKLIPFQICYCLLSYCPSFDLHFDFLYKLIENSRSTRISLIMDPENIFHEFDSLSDIIAFKVPTNELYSILEAYSLYSIQPKLSVNLEINESLTIEYELPSDPSLIDTIWPCCLIFSLLAFNELMICIFALLYKHSVVFKSKNFGYLSACVLGLHALSRAFVTDYIVSPILPERIKEILCSELPLLVGITYEMPATNKDIVLADLDAEFVVNFKLNVLDYRELYEKCRADYEYLQTRSCYSQGTDKELACFRVVKMVKMHLDKYLEQINAESQV